ncbi:MAG: hypothetical protein ACM3S5_04120 [Rhodospirillales bacterium]
MIRTILLGALVAGSAAAADLPVKEVVLYKNGLGYFVREGDLAPGESARLDFKAGDMNDVLKSLTVVEAGGGRISGLRYDSSEPLARKLSGFPFQLGPGRPLSALLDQLKGARIEMIMGAGKAEGTILSAREVQGLEKEPPREQITLLLDTGEIRTYDLSAVTAVRFTDPALQLQLKEYLGSLVAGRSQEKRSVYIDSTDAKARRVSVAYVIPTPVWKSSYRLVFPDSGEPVLEGWAIVDNTTGEDWTKVRLSLVSGRPVSFISRLYEPRYVQRREAELPEDQAAAPKIHEGAIAEKADAAAGPPREMRLEAPRARFFAAQPEAAPRPVTSSIEGAQARELGELFEYSFPTPVTVRKDESAMAPFLQQKLSARKLLIYSGDGVNPRNAAEITNSTGKTLDGGPITVYDGNAYAGEALMETLKGGDKRLISYAVDLGTRITTLPGSGSQRVREAQLRRGVLTTRWAAREATTYTIRNVDQKAKTLVIEHPMRPQYSLVNMQPAETTASAWRFEVKLAPGATEKFPVTEERVYQTTLMLVDATPDVLMTYVENTALSDAARKALARIADQKRAIAAVDGEIARTERQFNDVVQDQERLRQNISSLNRVSGQQDLVQKYARQLEAQETQLAGLRNRLSELRKKKAALEEELKAQIEKLEF